MSTRPDMPFRNPPAPQGAPPSAPTWHERIEAARKRGRFLRGDIERAGEWPDCACGEQDPRIPRDEKGRPEDYRLFSLGVSFAGKVDANQFDDAEHILGQIEIRAGEILADLDREHGHLPGSDQPESSRCEEDPND